MAMFPDQPSSSSVIDASSEEYGNSGTAEIFHLYLKLAKEHTEAVQTLTSRKINNQQCGYLSEKLQEVVQSTSSFVEHHGPDLYTDVERWMTVFKLLLVLANEVESFIRDCCKDAWIQSAMTLAKVTEYISSIAFQLEVCKFAFCKECAAIGTVAWDQVEDMDNTEVETARSIASADSKALLSKLISQLDTLPAGDKSMAAHLLHRLFEVEPKSSSTLQSSWWSSESLRSLFQRVVPLEQLGRGGSGEVHRATWLGAPVAKKRFWVPESSEFENEVEILAKLCHPNITSMFCCGKDTRSCSIVMELMDEDLHHLMNRRLAGKSGSPPFSIYEAVDIMLQTGEGVKYLHEKKIVHRDLKSSNILVKFTKAEISDSSYLHVKVADFALSKTKELSTCNQTFNTGTSRWMAPEIINLDVPSLRAGNDSRKHPFQSDVYSYGMVYYEILTGNVPFHDVVNTRELKEMVLAHKRPELPDSCPMRLKTLIRKCWDRTPTDRPTFAFICSELKYMKCLILTGFNEGSHSTLEEVWNRIRKNPAFELMCFEDDSIKETKTLALMCYFESRFLRLSQGQKLLLLGISMYYPKFRLWSKALTLLEWLSITSGATADFIKREVKIIREMGDLNWYFDGGTHEADVFSPSNFYMLMEAEKLEDPKDACWVHEVHNPHVGLRPDNLCLRDDGWEKLRQIYLNGGGAGMGAVRNLRYCTNVTMLTLVNCHLGQDQMLDLTSLQSLRSLEILSCTFSMSAGVVGLALLRNLAILRWNNIPTMSPSMEEIGCLTALQVLELESIENENAFPDVRELRLLKQLTLRFGLLSHFPDICWENLTQLRYLNLGNCYLMGPNFDVGVLVALGELDLSNWSGLKKLSGLRTLRSLRRLNLTGCGRVEELPGLEDLASLEELRVEGCRRLELPDITKLTKLRVYR